jgi:hypothetical protein
MCIARVWRFACKPFLKLRYWLIMRQGGWQGRYQREVRRWQGMNDFKDLAGY